MEREKEKKGIDLARQLNEWLQKCEGSIPETTWRDTSARDYKFYAGDQDEPLIKAKLAALNRPTTTYNQIKPKVDMLVGTGAQMRDLPAFMPVTAEDAPLTELVNGVVKHFRRILQMDDVENSCFEHMVKSGRSFLHFYIDNANPFEPKISIKRIAGKDVNVDPNSTEYDLSDARYVFIDKWFEKSEIEAYWPEIDASSLEVSNGSADQPTYYSSVEDLYRVVECWYRKVEKVIWFVNPMTGKQEWLLPKEYNQFAAAMAGGIEMPDGSVFQQEGPIQAMPAFKKTVHYALFSGDTLLESGPTPYKHDQFPYVQFGAYKNDDLNSWFGAITMMCDPQIGLNTIRRQLTHLLQIAPRGILMHETGAIANIEDYEERGADPTYHMEINPGKLDKVKFSTQPQISPIYQYLDRMNDQAMKDASGVQDEMMGIQQTSREPGVTVQARYETGMAVLYILFKNFRRSRKQAMVQLLAMIQQYVTDETLIRIEGQNGLELIRINSQLNPQVQGWNDISAGVFDLEYEEASIGALSRQGIAKVLSDYASTNPGTIPPEIILEHSNVPYSVRMRVQQSSEAARQAAAEAQQREAAVAEQEMQIKMYEAETKRMALEKQREENT
jgi:hypothetical protein